MTKEQPMNSSRAVLGLTFVALGALMLLDRAGLVDAGTIVADWWPVMLLVLAGLELLARPPRRIAAGVFALLGVVLLTATTGLLTASAWSLLWPTLIIVLGGWLLLRGGRRPHVDGTSNHDGDFDVAAVFAGRRIASTADPLQHGNAIAVFGSVELDLAAARIDDRATLELVAVFGGVEVRVPPGWRVELDGPAIFGGLDNHVPPLPDAAAPTLRITATAIFGGVDIKTVAVPRMTPA